jgi:predicted peroxiredoxin
MTATAPLPPALSLRARTGVAMLLWATDPARAALCATPFFHAAAAAALDVRVEMYFTSRSVLLLVPQNVRSLRAGQEGRAVAEYMALARQGGVQFLACTEALAAHGVGVAQVAAAVDGYAGAAAFMARALDPDWTTLTY